MLDNFDKNKNPFKVPENYFEGLTQGIMNSMPPQEEKQVKKVTLWKKVLPWTAVAAVIITVFIAVGTIGDMPAILANDKDNQKKTEINLAYNEVDDYFLFLEDEATEAMYNEVMFEGVE